MTPSTTPENYTTLTDATQFRASELSCPGPSYRARHSVRTPEPELVNKGELVAPHYRRIRRLFRRLTTSGLEVDSLRKCRSTLPLHISDQLASRLFVSSIMR